MPAIPAASEDQVLSEQAEYVIKHHEDSRYAELRKLLMSAFEDSHSRPLFSEAAAVALNFL